MCPNFVSWASLSVASLFTCALAQNVSEGLEFGPVSFAGYNNWVYRDSVTSAQLVLSNSASATEPSRFIAAFAEGNTGALVYFVPASNNSTGGGNSSALSTYLDEGSLTSYEAGNNQTGLQGNLQVSTDLTFGVTLIGSVRTLRDYVESGGNVTNSIFNYTLGPYNDSSVTLVRNWINGTTVQYLSFDVITGATFNVTPSDNTTLPPDISLSLSTPGTNATLHFVTSYNWTGTTPSTPFIPLEGLDKSSLFLTNASSNAATILSDVLTAIQGPGAPIADQVAFLSYSDRFFAGGWRFLTYFGRDTLLALRLLLPVISPTSAEAILGAVIERTNETGTICHEETIGDYASWVNIQNNQSELGNTPVYNYVMLDTDFLLLPVLADYFLTTPQGSNRSTAFLKRQSPLKNGTFEQLLLKNVDHVLSLSKPFAEDPRKENLVPIRDPVVGNWRDSSPGLGYGIYPFDVETALIPAALRAIASLAAANILPSNYSYAGTYARTWEQAAPPLFEIPVTATKAQTSLNNYVQQSNLSEALLYGGGSLNVSSTNTTANGSLGWGDVSQTIGGSNDSFFYALSLKEDFSPVEVLHSDLGFALLYGNNVSASLIQATVEALQPYPRGLLTNVGMVVANAAYDSNTTNIEVFSNVAYHGAVSWSWQQGLMASGVSRQLGLCGLSPSTQLQTTLGGDRPVWCNDMTITDALTQAQARLWTSIEGSAPALYTEVLSPVFDGPNGTFTIGDLGAISPEGTEGDAIQLWSYGFLAEVDPRSGRPVAAGFA